MATVLSINDPNQLLKVAIVGHVDHGKSTVVGRLLHDTDSLPDGKIESVRAMCEKRGMPFEWAFVTDALQAERDQGITIDASHIRFSSDVRDYVLIDAPGHREFLKNMISGAAGCDAALVVIDATEGVRDQSRRHGYLLHLLGVQQVAVAVTKMDLAGFDEKRFAEVEREFRNCLEELSGDALREIPIIPLSGRDGDNISARSDRMGWYDGPTLIEALDKFETAQPQMGRPLRLSVQDVYRFDSRRIVAGRVDSGHIEVGDKILISPSNHTVCVKSIESWGTEKKPLAYAVAGQSIGITLDEQVFVERGEVISHAEDPPIETNVFRGRLFWMGDQPMRSGNRYKLRLATNETVVEVDTIERVVDTSAMSEIETDEVQRDSVADVILRSRAMLALDPAEQNLTTGRFVLTEDMNIVGGGLVSMEGYPDQRELITKRSTNITAVENRVTPEMRVHRNGHAGAVLWLTGLSGSGKSTISIEAERRLFQKGYQVYVLDGDNLRYGLNANLGCSPEDRGENIRRVGEVAALFARAGFVVISAFISPYLSDRQRARDAAGDMFKEVFIDAKLETCEARDPKGLYKKARTGEIADFTGISAPYERPEQSELVIDTSVLDQTESVSKLLEFIEETIPISNC